MKIIVWAAPLEALHGQAMMTAGAVEALRRNHDVLVVTYREGLRGLLSVVQGVRQIVRSIGTNGASVIYASVSRSAFGFLRDVPVLLVARWYKVPVVAHLHGNDFINLDRGMRPLARIAYRRVTVLTCSEVTRVPSFIASDRIITVRNFVRAERLLALDELLPSTAPVATDFVVCLHISNLHVSKGALLSALATQHLNRQTAFTGQRYRLFIFGRPAADHLASAADVAQAVKTWLEASDDVRLGWIRTDEEFQRATKDARIFCFPTEYPMELAPVAVIEAMCNGLWLVVTDRPILRDLCKGYPYVRYVPPLPTAIALAMHEVSQTDWSDRRSVALAARERFSRMRYESAIQNAVSKAVTHA